MKNKYRIVTESILILACLSLFNSNITIASPPLPDIKTIKIGMTTALSGPAKDLGQDMKRGIEAYFKKINTAGGIDGRKLELIALDDQYEPALAAPNMRQLIDNDEVIAVIGNVGTPTAIVTVPIANEKKTLLFGAFTGAGVLRKDPPDRYVINFRASYEEETSAMIKGLLSVGIKPDELAFFTQNDAYGDSGYQGAMKALKATGYSNPELLPYGRYVRNTLNVEAGLTHIMNSKIIPKAIIMVGAYAPNAKFIELAKQQFPNTLFLNVSFVGTNAIARGLGKNSNNVIITQVVPYFSTDLAAIRDYHHDMNSYFPGVEPGLGSLEGYLAAKLFVAGLQKAALENKLTREGLIDVFENMHNVDIGIGEMISFDKIHHQALHTVWPTILKEGKLVPLNWTTLTVKSK